MRFLFVYQDSAKDAKRLLDELGVDDVTLVIAREGTQSPTPNEFEILRVNQGAQAALCGVHRKYKRSLSAVTLSYEAKQFRFEDQQLRAWLVPASQAVDVVVRPSLAFATAVLESNTMLVLHPNALGSADELVEHRWEFANQGAKLLARYAKGDELGALRDWKATHGVDFAAHGRVTYKGTVSFGDEDVSKVTQWHLKQGDNTSQQSAARIYFVRIDFKAGTRVVVYYVGPHPADGVYEMSAIRCEPP